jgi:hypothetical protein
MAQQKQGPKSTKPKAPAQKPISPRQAQKEAELMKKYPGGTLVRNPVPGTLQTNVGGKRIQYTGNVKVMSPKKEKDTRSQKAMPSIAPRGVKQIPTNMPLPNVSRVAAPDSTKTGKKIGRLRTAVSDATSSVRGAANLAFGKNQSQTTGGKILERGARLATAGLGMTAAGVPGSAANYGTKIAKATNKATGYIKKGTKAAASGALKSAGLVAGAAGVAIPVIKGQMNFKNRTEESKKRGIMNPGKGKANLGKINFDKPFQKKTAAADSSSKSKKK